MLPDAQCAFSEAAIFFCYHLWYCTAKRRVLHLVEPKAALRGIKMNSIFE